MVAGILIAQSVTISLVIITLKIIADAPLSYLLQFLMLGLIVLGITCLVCVIFLRLVRSYKISDLIKNRKPVRAVFIVNMIARTLLLTFICVSLFNIAPTIYELNQEYQIYQKWDVYGNQYAITDMKFTNDIHTDRINNTHIFDKKSADFYSEYANKNGAIYTNINSYNPLVNLRYVINNSTGQLEYPDYFNPEWVPENFEPIIYTVNINYLLKFPLIGEDGKTISISEQEVDAVYLLPDTYKINGENIKKILEAERKSCVESSQSYAPGIETEKSTNIKVIYYQSGVNVFTFDTRIGEDTNYTVKDPIFSVMTENNSLFIDKKDGFSNGINAYIKFDLNHGSPEQQYNHMKQALYQYGLENNIVNLTKINSSFENKISEIKLGLSFTMGMIGILFLLAVLISIQTVATRMRMISKQVAVKKMFGYSFFGKYGKEMAIYGVTWIVQWVASILIFIASQSGGVGAGQQSINYFIPFIALIVFVMDAVILFGITLFYDRKNINCSIRRDD